MIPAFWLLVLPCEPHFRTLLPNSTRRTRIKPLHAPKPTLECQTFLFLSILTMNPLHLIIIIQPAQNVTLYLIFSI